MITAKGIKDGKKMTVVYKDGKYTFNGKEDEIYMAQMKVLLKAQLPIYGTYYSSDPKDELNVVGKLAEYFFDKPAVVTSDHEIENDWEDGVVY